MVDVVSCWECGAKGGSHHRECRLHSVDALQRVLAWAHDRNKGRAPWNVPRPDGSMVHPDAHHGPMVGCDACDAQRAALEEMVPPHERVHQVTAVNIDLDGSVEAVSLEDGSKVMGINQAAMHRNAETGECFLQVEFRCRNGVSVDAPDGSTLSINDALNQYGVKPESPAPPPAPVILDPRGRPVSSTGSAKAVSTDSRVRQLGAAIERLIASGNAMAEMGQYAVHADSGHQATKRAVRGCPPCEAINDWLVVLNDINECVAMPVSDRHPDVSRGPRS